MSPNVLAARAPVMERIVRFIRASALQHHVAVLPPHINKVDAMKAACNHTKTAGVSKPGTIAKSIAPLFKHATRHVIWAS